MPINSPSSTSIYEVFEHQKTELLLHILETSPHLDKVMVFVRTRDGVHTLTSALAHAGVSVESIHGQKKVELRDRALKAFSEGKIRVLITTDAFARGLEITGFNNVINVDFPELHNDYLQRLECVKFVGGEIITFFTPKDVSAFAKWEASFGEEIPRKKSEGFAYDTQSVNVKPQRKKGGTSKGLRSKPLQNKKPKFKNKRGRR